MTETITAPTKQDERYKSTVGFKRNNPGNLMVQTIPYAGKATKQSKEGPVAFCTMAWGLRALAVDLKKKMEAINKIAALIKMYAPPKENDTAGYIKFVASELKKSPDEVVRWDDLSKLVMMKVIIRMEIGYGFCPFSEDELKKAIEAAKISIDASTVEGVCDAPKPYTPP